MDFDRQNELQVIGQWAQEAESCQTESAAQTCTTEQFTTLEQYAFFGSNLTLYNIDSRIDSSE